MAKRSGGLVDEKDKKKVTREGLIKALRIFRFVLPYKVQFITGLVFLAFSSVTVLAFPFATGKLVDSAMGTAAGYTRNTIALSLIGILILQGTFSFFRVALFARVSELALKDIRLSLYSKILCLPVPFLEKRRVGELTSRLTSDVSQLQDILSFTLAEFIRQLLTLLVGIVIITTTSPRLTLVMLGSFPFLVAGAIVFGRFIRKLSKKVQDELAAANIVVEETLQSIQAVKTFTNEWYEMRRYNTALTRVVGNALQAAKYRGLFISFVIFAIFGGIVLVMWYGLGLVAAKELSIGSLVSFIIYTTFIGGAVGGMGDLYGQLQKTIGASERILEIMDEVSEVGEKEPKISEKRLYGDIRFRGVKFAYPSRPELTVLNGISLDVEAGKKVALVGHSGAGKSTITQLLMRFYHINSGAIIVDGKNVNEYDITELRRNIGIVPQEVLLFGGTIGENIAYGRPNATEAEIINAAKKANAWDFISSFPEGLETVVGERGVKLSGGQRQRVAIARAVLKDPSILILDEATSSLDAESEQLVQQALDELMKNRTTIIIAHRLATIRKVDTIYVLNEGVISETGSHQDLLAKGNGIYSNLVKLQFDAS